MTQRAIVHQIAFLLRGCKAAPGAKAAFQPREQNLDIMATDGDDRHAGHVNGRCILYDDTCDCMIMSGEL